MNDNREIKFYSNEEIEKLINEIQTERLVFIDDGIDEVIGRFKDLPNIIVDLNRKFGSKDLKIRNFIEPEDEPIIETFGMFLHKISPEDREEIIALCQEIGVEPQRVGIEIEEPTPEITRNNNEMSPNEVDGRD